MKTHQNVFHSDFIIFFVSDINQITCFFFLEKIADLSKQSSRRVLSVVSAY